MGDLVHLKTFQPDPRRLEDFRDPVPPATYAPGFLDLGVFHTLACGLSRTWVARRGPASTFPEPVRLALCVWAEDRIRGLRACTIRPDGAVHLQTADDWGAYDYRTQLNLRWLTQQG